MKKLQETERKIRERTHSYMDLITTIEAAKKQILFFLKNSSIIRYAVNRK